VQPAGARFLGEDDWLEARLQKGLVLGKSAVAGDERLAVAAGDKRAGWDADAPNNALVVDGFYRCQIGAGVP
jgi:hypothetical protein